MFSNVTWLQFFLFFFIGVLIYYPILLWLYYRQHIIGFVSQSRFQGDAQPDSDMPQQSLMDDQSNPTQDNDIAQTALVANLMEAIKEAVAAAIEKKASRDQLLALLKSILHNYQELRQSPQRVQLNEFIIAECQKAKVFLAMAQVYALWSASESTGA